MRGLSFENLVLDENISKSSVYSNLTSTTVRDLKLNADRSFVTPGVAPQNTFSGTRLARDGILLDLD